MILTVTWKEYREQRTVWFFMALMATILVVLVTVVYPSLNNGVQPGDTRLHLLIATAGCVLTYGVVCGAMLLAGERESSTLAFLDALTGQRMPVWGAKLIPGMLLCLSQALFVGVLAAVACPADVDHSAMMGHSLVNLEGWVFPFALPVLALDAFVWGLAASALCQNVLAAAGLAAMSWLLGWLLLLPCWTLNSLVVVMGGRIVLDIAVLFLSAMAFCQSQTAERPEAVASVPRRVKMTRSPSSWHVLVWLPLRQGWAMLLIMAVLALFFGLVLPTAGPLYWFGITIIVAVLCGTSTFGGEQSDLASRFLGNQRFPMGQVWGAKTGFWFTAALTVAVLFLSSGLFSLFVIRPADVPPLHVLLDSSPLLNGRKLLIFLPLGILYGFCIGQFYSLLWRKSVVAVVMALLVSPSFAMLWLPSLTFGGLRAWVVFVPPLVLLAATRLVMWSWGSTGLALRKPVLTLTGCGVFSLFWFSVAFGNRVWEVPNTEISYDPADFQASIPKPKTETSQAAARMRSAGEEFAKRLGQVTWHMPPQLDRGLQIEKDRTQVHSARVARLLQTGWPQQDERLDNWMEMLFEKADEAQWSWAQLYAQAADMELGAIEHPLGDTSLQRDLTVARRAVEAGCFLEARALQLQKAGRDGEALDVIHVMLKLSRQLRNYALTVSYSYGRQLEHKALTAFSRWLAPRRCWDAGRNSRGDTLTVISRWLAARRQSALLRRAVAMLVEHDQTIPSASLSVLAEDCRMRDALVSGSLFGDQKLRAQDPTAESELVFALWMAPWERARYTRILNSLTEAGLHVAKLEPGEAALLLDSMDGDDGHTSRSRRLLNRGLSLLDSKSTRSDLERWQRLLEDNPLDGVFQVETLEARVQDGINLSALRAAQLQAALLLYQQTQGNGLPESLDALVKSQCISAIPLDPFDGRPFRYRRTDGKDVDWGKPADVEDAARMPAEVSAILWSVGPDGVDHGGLSRGDPSKPLTAKSWASQRFDLIFAVPAWSKK
jgi:hypothetical protein